MFIGISLSEPVPLAPNHCISVDFALIPVLLVKFVLVSLLVKASSVVSI